MTADIDKRSAPPRVLLYAGSQPLETPWSAALQATPSELVITASLDEFLDLLAGLNFDVAVCDWELAGPRVSEVTLHFERSDPATQLIWLAVPKPPRLVGDLLAGPAFSWLESDAGAERMRLTVQQASERCRLLRENRGLKRRLSFRRTRDLVGHSPVMERLRQQINAAASCDLPVLICGARGTGKELVARALHDASERAYRPLIKVNCAVLTSASLERELFGQGEPGGPTATQPGRLSMAAGGVLLLDDVDGIALPAQLKLLRVFEERGFVGPGQTRESVDVRVVATSSQPLTKLVAEGLFREDLYQYLNQFSIQTPDLQEHPEDLAQLTEHFLNQIAAREGKLARRIPLDTLQLLQTYGWPGNVRELENLIERACALDLGTRLTVEMLHPWLAVNPAEHGAPAHLSLKEMERKLIESTFTRLGGNRERTAQALQIGLRTLSGKLREYGYPPRGGPGSNQQTDERAA